MKLLRLIGGLVFVTACFIASLLGPVAAFAQDASASPSAIDPSSWLYVVWTIVQPIVTLLVTLFGPVIIGIVVAYLVKLLKITDATQQAALESQLTAAIHQSAANAVKFALGKLGLPATAALTADVISLAASYVQDKNPDGLAKLNISPSKLQDILVAKAHEVANTPAPAATSVPAT